MWAKSIGGLPATELVRPAYAAWRRARDATVAHAAVAGITVESLAPYRLQHPSPGGLRPGFAAFSEASFHAGVEQLAAALVQA